MEQLTISTHEASEIAGLPVGTVLACCKRTDELRLPNVHLGHAYRVIASEIPAWLMRMSDAQREEAAPRVVA